MGGFKYRENLNRCLNGAVSSVCSDCEVGEVKKTTTTLRQFQLTRREIRRSRSYNIFSPLRFLLKVSYTFNMAFKRGGVFGSRDLSFFKVSWFNSLNKHVRNAFTVTGTLLHPNETASVRSPELEFRDL